MKLINEGRLERLFILQVLIGNVKIRNRLIRDSDKVWIEKETVYVDALQKITKEEVVNNIENNIAKLY